MAIIFVLMPLPVFLVNFFPGMVEILGKGFLTKPA